MGVLQFDITQEDLLVIVLQFDTTQEGLLKIVNTLVGMFMLAPFPIADTLDVVLTVLYFICGPLHQNVSDAMPLVLVRQATMITLQPVALHVRWMTLLSLLLMSRLLALSAASWSARQSLALLVTQIVGRQG